MSRDRITQIRIRGLRVIEDVTLDLDGLMVLIGDNGSGKSTILEAFEILRLAATPGIRFPQDLSRSFGRIGELIRYGSDDLTLGVVVEGQGQKFDYSFTIAMAGQRDAFITRETVISWDGVTKLVDREGNRARILGGGPSYASEEESRENITGGNFIVQPERLVLSSFDEIPASPVLRRVRDALLGIELHVPFEVRPSWQQKERDIRESARSAVQVTTTERVERYGINLPNCFYALKNRGPEIWERVLNRAQLALGHDLRDFVFPPSRGDIEMEAVFAGKSHNISIHGMSEGQLSFLLLIAIVELEASRSVLAFDEPEIHLHPSLLVNALYLLETAAEHHPVLLATHSDRLLDALEDPVKSVVLCELDERNATRLLRPDRKKLDLWLENYRGLGSLRAEGYDFAVFDPHRLAKQEAPK